MKLYELFKASLHSPKKIAAFRLIPIGKVMQYIFIYVFLMTAISFFGFINGISEQQQNVEGLIEYFSDIQWLIYPFAFIFLFVLNTMLIFVRISIFAYIGTLMLLLLKRRGEYRHLWRSTLFASTVPMIISIVMAILQLSNDWVQLGIYAVTFVYLYISLKYYPIKK